MAEASREKKALSSGSGKDHALSNALSGFHTPFCDKVCSVNHHNLVRVLFIDDNRCKQLSNTFRDCVSAFEAKGWNKNSVVPDDLDKLQLPLLHLASSFGRYSVVDYLLGQNFSPTTRDKDGGTALHAALKNFYQVACSRYFTTLTTLDRRCSVFEKMVKSMSKRCPHIFGLKDANGETVLHVAARSIVSQPQNTPRRGPKPRSSPFYEKCLRAMINQLHALEEFKVLTQPELLEALNSQDADGNTIFHILACGNFTPGRSALEHALLKVDHLPAVKNNNAKTALDLASAFIGSEQANQLFKVNSGRTTPSGSCDSKLSPIPEVKQQHDESVEPKAGTKIKDQCPTMEEGLQDNWDVDSPDEKEFFLDEDQFSFTSCTENLIDGSEWEVSPGPCLDGSLQLIISEGAEELDPAAKSEVLSIFLKQYRTKLEDIEAVKIPKLNEEMKAEMADLEDRWSQLQKAEEELCKLRNYLKQKEMVVKGFREKIQGLQREGNSLKRKISLCQTTEEQLSLKNERIE